MKVLVAGGGGFIGSHLCEELINKQHTVICVDNFLTSDKRNLEALLNNPRFSLIEHDVIEPLDFNEHLDAVFHLASPASPNIHSKISYHALAMPTMLVNTVGTKNLLELSLKNKARFLFASTSEIYGDPEVNPQTEDYRGNVSTTGPRSVYDEAKRFGETLTYYYYRYHKLDVRITRIFNTYGPRILLEDQRMLTNFIVQALKNEPITIYGDGKQTRSLCYVDDLVGGLIKFMFSKDMAGKIINFGTPVEHAVYEYAELVKDLAQSKSKIVFSDKLPEDDPKERCPDITRAKTLLKWQPTTKLKEGIIKTIAYYQKL